MGTYFVEAVIVGLVFDDCVQSHGVTVDGAVRLTWFVFMVFVIIGLGRIAQALEDLVKKL